jgi:hypothetical protein
VILEVVLNYNFMKICLKTPKIHIKIHIGLWSLKLSIIHCNLNGITKLNVNMLSLKKFVGK